MPEQPAQVGGATTPGPQLELRVPARVRDEHERIEPAAHAHVAYELVVAPVQPFGHAQQRRQPAHRAARPPRQRGVDLVALPARTRSAMVARDRGDDVDLLGREPAQPAAADDVGGVLGVAVVGDCRAQVVQQRSELQPFALAVAESVPCLELVEQPQRQQRHVPGVSPVRVEAREQAEHAAQA